MPSNAPLKMHAKAIPAIWSELIAGAALTTAAGDPHSPRGGIDGISVRHTSRAHVRRPAGGVEKSIQGLQELQESGPGEQLLRTLSAGERLASRQVIGGRPRPRGNPSRPNAGGK